MQQLRFLVFILCVMIPQLGFTQTQTVGLFVNTEEAYNGYTLFSNNRTTYLIDNCGFVINTWESNTLPGASVYLLENGNLLRTGRIGSPFSGGGGGGLFELYSWDGDILWSYTIADENNLSHHDIEPLPNGNFLAMVWTKISAEEVEANGRNSDEGVWIEKVIEIEMVGSSEANIVWEWSMLDHLVQDFDASKLNFGVIADHPERMNFNFGITSGQDWAHCNGIDYNPELDQIAISSRNFSEIWIIDKSTTTEEAQGSTGGNSGMGGDILYRYGNPQVYARGNQGDKIFAGQHNVEWVKGGLPGELSVFNNNWQPNRSRVERWIAPIENYNYFLEEGQAFGPDNPIWEYTDPQFFSGRISSVQILPNKNALICEGTSGHFFEVNVDGKIVWDYLNPVDIIEGPVEQGITPSLNDVFKIIRYPADYPAFIGKDLTPGNPIELLPLDSNCQIFDNMTATDNVDEQLLTVLNNPVEENLRIFSDYGGLHLELFNQTGVLIQQAQLSQGINTVACSHLIPGIYILHVRDEKKMYTQKIIKL